MPNRLLYKPKAHRGARLLKLAPAAVVGGLIGWVLAQVVSWLQAN